jgi:hypothetical protein
MLYVSLGRLTSYLAEMPVLLIDDESDQSSINTKRNRPPGSDLSATRRQ